MATAIQAFGCCLFCLCGLAIVGGSEQEVRGIVNMITAGVSCSCPLWSAGAVVCVFEQCLANSLMLG